MNQKSSGDEEVKGFNDSELEDIMNEIEHLEKEFVEGSSDSQVKASDIAVEKVDNEKPLESKMEENSPSSVVSPISHQNILGPISPSLHANTMDTSATEGHSQTSFDLKVQGNIGLSMSFCIGEQVITLRVEDHGLHIELSNGAKFSIPLEEFKKSA